MSANRLVLLRINAGRVHVREYLYLKSHRSFIEHDEDMKQLEMYGLVLTCLTYTFGVCWLYLVADSAQKMTNSLRIIANNVCTCSACSRVVPGKEVAPLSMYS